MKAATKRNLRLWINKVSAQEAIARLIRAGIAASTADQIINDNYDHEPRGLNRRAIEAELAKDGFSMTGEKAS